MKRLLLALLLFCGVASADQRQRRMLLQLPNVTSLPNANPRILPDYTTYDALSVDTQADGYSYTDPDSGLTVYKLTDSDTPEVSDLCSLTYSDGGFYVSYGWGPGNNSHTVLFRCEPSGGGTSWWLVDHVRGSGPTNYRQITVTPNRDVGLTFSAKRSTPRHAYVFDINGAGQADNSIERIDTETNTVDNIGNWPPLNVPDGDAGGTWLQVSKDDIWVSVNDAGTSGWVWNSETDAVITQTPTNVSGGEPRLDHSGRYVVWGGGSFADSDVWDLSSDTIVDTTDGSDGGVFHSADCFGYIVSTDIGLANAPNVLYGPDNSPAAWDGDTILDPGSQNGHLSCSWIQYGTSAWITASNVLEDGTCAAGTLYCDSMGMFKVDGSEDARYVAGQFSENCGDYWDNTFANSSPDGKVMVFTSNMSVGCAGRGDLFLVELPLNSEN